MIFKNRSILKTFVKAQFSSLTATLLDFSSTIFFTELLGIWYVASSAMGGILGGLTNFYLGRYWVFQAQQKNAFTQGWKYVVVWFLSLQLNVTGIYFFTDVQKFPYIVSKIIVSVLVGAIFNFNLQKIFVFKT